MNPSSAGWINKFIKEFEKTSLWSPFDSDLAFYTALKSSGFIYGMSLSSIGNKVVSPLQLTQEEFTKINLLHSLLYCYFKAHPDHEYPQAIEKVVAFYQQIGKGKPGLLQKLSFSKSPTENLEAIINARLHENGHIENTEITSLFTYVLLYIDVLTFHNYVRDSATKLKENFETLELMAVQSCAWSLESKEKPKKYDLVVIDMLQSALNTPIAFASASGQTLTTQIQSLGDLAKQFFVDVCCLGIWDDKVLDAQEIDFLDHYEHRIGFAKDRAKHSLEDLREFSQQHATKIKLFEHANPIKHLYKTSSDMVKLMILRNKNRLIKELLESGELLKLLTLSTVRDLNPEEKQKVKEQLLDVCKTIPSLTLFLLPGGSLLLPIMVKLIPKMLPSAFNDNAIDD